MLVAEYSGTSVVGSPASDAMFLRISCETCKDYRISEYVKEKQLKMLSLEDKSRLSGYLRECWEYTDDRNHDPYLSNTTLDSTKLKRLLVASDLPKKGDIERKIFKFLRILNVKTQYYGQMHTLNYKVDYPIAYAQNTEEFIKIISTLTNSDLIESEMSMGGQVRILITLKGMQAIKESNIDSKQIFVALAFTSEIKANMQNVSRVVEEKTGYTLLTIDRKEHNNDITDEIVAEINKSRALIADFTDNNYGAYYEAGYAHGLGLEVIFVCKDAVDDQGGKLIDKVHFDINHRNHIIWKDIEDLTNQLVNRINATINRPITST